MDLSTYYTKLKTLWDELDGINCVKICHHCDCCKAIDTKLDHAKVIKFLTGLNDSYSTIRSQIIMKKHVPDLSQVYNLLDQDHSQRSITPVHNASAFQVTYDHMSVHATASYYTNQKNNHSICAHCGYTGHTVDTCYKIHGYPVGFKHKIKSQSDKQQYPAKSQPPAKPVVAQMAFVPPSTYNISSLVTTLSKDQIQGVMPISTLSCRHLMSFNLHLVLALSLLFLVWLSHLLPYILLEF